MSTVNNLDNNIDLEEAKYRRMNRAHQPDYAPGQEPDMGTTVDDLLSDNDSSFGFSNAPTFVDNNSMANSFNVFNQAPGGFNTGFNMGPSPNGMMQQQPQSGPTYEDFVKGTKKTVNALGVIFGSFSKLNILFWYNYCSIIWVEGLVCLGLSLASWLLGFKIAFPLLITGIAFLFGGFGTCMILKDDTMYCHSEYKEEPKQNTVISNEVPQFPGISHLDDTNDFEDAWNIRPNQHYDEEQEENDDGDNEEHSDCGLDNDDDGDEDWNLNEINENEKKQEEKVDPEAVISSVENDNVPAGMYTRQYLYDKFTALLPSIYKGFNELEEIDEDSDAFVQVDEAVQEAVRVSGCKETIELKAIKENYATVVIITTRPQGLNLDKVAFELSKIYAHRNSAIKDVSRVYAKAEAVGEECIFTIFTGSSDMISLKDMYEAAKDYVLDANNYMPVVFGIDSMAEVVAYDLKKLESIIVAGMPRSGKSWFVQNMITQMCAFVSPKELHLYICDPKGDISDFKSFCLPHVKKFVSGDDRIMDVLRYLVNEEAPRRKKIIGAGTGRESSQNIWDYKLRHPNVELPVIYVVIDELVTLASRMDKDTFTEFKMILRELISQLPALGIRAILIPHILNNEIIEKKTSDLVLCRISVCGAADHIEKVTGAKEKEFPYKLTKPGDMAVRMPLVRQEIMYLRAPVLTPSNPENNDLFDYMRQVWNKLEPTETGRQVEIASTKTVVQQVIENANDIDLFESDEDIEDLF